VAVLGVILGLATLSAVAAEAEKAKGPMGAKGEQVTMTGKLNCMFCTLAHPDKPCPKDCCANCVKAGDPIVLTAADGAIYVLIAGQPGEKLMTPERTELLNQQVTVKGMLVKAKGIQAIYVESMEKAAAKVSVAGKLSCTFCILAHPGKASTKECCIACIKSGDPAALTDAEGNVYTLISGQPGEQLITAERMEWIGEQIAIQGMLVRANGVQAIYVDSIQKAQTQAKQN
jgi:hypothetical protein